MKPREQEVYSLNLKSSKILRLKTKNTFFEKGAGLATITRGNALDYCKRVLPDKYERLKKYYDAHPADLILDFENHFTEFENSYKTALERTIISKKIKDIQDKTFLSFFIFIQTARNHNHLEEAFSIFEENSMARFELLLNLKHTISNPDQLMQLVLPYLTSKWTLYSLEKSILPLSDNPVLIRPSHIYLPLSPDLLLEVDLKKKVEITKICSLRRKLSLDQYNEVKKRTIENSSREIVFGTKEKLERWSKSKFYKNHLSLIKTISTNNKQQ